MIRQPLDQVAPGSVLAKTIHDSQGRPLLVAGSELTPWYLDSLRRRGIAAVYVRDGLTDDVVPDDVVSVELRATLTRHLSTTFRQVTTIASERGMGSGGVDGAADALGEQALDLGPEGVDTVRTLYTDVEVLIAEILETDTVAGLESLKSHSEYTFQHSVDVAVIGTLLGRNLGMPRSRLRELALGCLLHDIGKSYVEQAILDKPGKLTEEEWAAIQEHPRMGYELVRRMPVHSLLPAHVAYQHHEQQGGRGYPRGLVGDNRVGDRLLHERIGAGQMLLIAEIGAVADVYSALTSDRPYRPALLPDRVATMLLDMSGQHLNREIVRLLLQLVPSYPVGRWIEVTRGRFTGWRGVVTEVHRTRMTRPTVRLVLDPRGEQVADPVVIDTRTEEEIRLACLAEEELGKLIAPDADPLGPVEAEADVADRSSRDADVGSDEATPGAQQAAELGSWAGGLT